jgi:hypothetical protein
MRNLLPKYMARLAAFRSSIQKRLTLIAPAGGIAISLGLIVLFGYLAFREITSSNIDSMTTNGYALGIIGCLFAITVFLEILRNTLNSRSAFFKWIGGLSHEFAGALVTGILFLVLVTIPEEQAARIERETRLRNEEIALKTQTLFELSSRDNSTAIKASEIIRRKGWHTDDSLVNISLDYANFSKSRI